MGDNWVTIQMYFAASIRSTAVAARFFDVFRSIFPELEFESMDEVEPLKKRFDVSEAVIEWERNRGNISTSFGDYIFFGKKPAPFYAFSDWYGTGTHQRVPDRVSVSFDKAFWSNQLLDAMSRRAISLLKELSHLNSSLYGNILSSSEFDAKNFLEKALPRGGRSWESIMLTPREGLADLYSVNYFGKPYLDIFGEVSVEKVECPMKEKVGDGVLLVFSPDPTQWKDEKILELQAKAKAVLDRRAFFDKLTGFRPELGLN